MRHRNMSEEPGEHKPVTTEGKKEKRDFRKTESAQTGIAQTWTTQTGIAQTGIAQTGIVQTGSAQIGITQTGIGQTWTTEGSAANTGHSADGTWDAQMGISEEEREFIRQYRADAYERPSVTADIVVFTLDEEDVLNILLIQRKGFPYKDHWAIPGGFLDVNRESIDDTARRELREETGLTLDSSCLRQLYTFGRPDRDPRTHVVSVAYTALIPKAQLHLQAGDDARDARLFRIRYDIGGMLFESDGLTIGESQLAFDHAMIIRTAITRIRGRIDYEPDAFWLLKNRSEFTIYELKRIYESIKNTELDTANFRKSFIRNYVNTGRVIDLQRKRRETGKKPTELYAYVEKVVKTPDDIGRNGYEESINCCGYAE